jgi:hypothetical protein
MSSKNGDKSRFGRKRKEQIARRGEVRELRASLGKASPKPANSAPRPDGKS